MTNNWSEHYKAMINGSLTSDKKGLFKLNQQGGGPFSFSKNPLKLVSNIANVVNQAASSLQRIKDGQNAEEEEDQILGISTPVNKKTIKRKRGRPRGSTSKKRTSRNNQKGTGLNKKRKKKNSNKKNRGTKNKNKKIKKINKRHKRNKNKLKKRRKNKKINKKRKIILI